MDKTTGVAVKRLHAIPDSELQVFMKELKMCLRLRHPHIVIFYGHYFSTKMRRRQPVLNLVMELGDTDLHYYLKNQSDTSKLPLDWAKALQFSLGIAKALAYLHGREIVHLDLKSPNVLLCGEVVKICDFGSARNLNPSSTQSTIGKGPRGRFDDLHFAYSLVLKLTFLFYFQCSLDGS